MALTTKNERGEIVPLLNIANVLTIIRLVLVPVFIAVLWVDNPAHRWWAFAVFALAASTDKLDGMLARSRGLITDFGKLADSIADKALIIAALLLLSIHGLLWWWVTAIFIVRELGITWMRMALKKRKVMAAGWWGKVKMFAQSIGIALLLVPWESFMPGGAKLGDFWASILSFSRIGYMLGYIAVAVALFFALLSAYGYVREGLRVARGE